MNWGDVPTWISAVVTAVALVAAFRVYKIESGRDARAEKDRLRAEDERLARFQAERRAQADKIAAWYDDEDFNFRGVIIRNASDLPVYDVRIELWSDGDKVYELKDPVNVVPPDDERRIDEAGYAPEIPDYSEPHARLSITFRDAAGTRWTRDMNGFLTELPPPSLW